LAEVGFDLAVQEAEKRGFARAIAAQQANPLARLDLTRDPIEQQGSAKTNAQFANRNQGHNQKRAYQESSDRIAAVGETLLLIFAAERKAVKAWRPAERPSHLSGGRLRTDSAAATAVHRTASVAAAAACSERPAC
jgi:hypothetical protein